MGLVEASESGDRLETLVALRDVLAASIVSADPEKRAPLAARFTEVLDRIAALTPEEKAGDPVDEIARRRAARGSGPSTGKGGAAADQG